MNIISILRLVLIPCLFIQGSIVIANEAIPFGKSFLSPNGIYSVYLADIDKTPHFIIQNTNTGLKDESLEMPTVLLFLAWSDDSKAFVTIEHIANGSYGRITWLEDGKWFSAHFEPPGDGPMDYKITKLEMSKDVATFTYVVAFRKSDGYPINYKVCDIGASLVTGDVLTIQCKSTTEAEALARLARRPEYLQTPNHSN